MKRGNDDFCAGVIAALVVVDRYGKDEIYEAIVATVDEAELIDFARRDGMMRLSGLTKHGYGKKYPAPKRDKAGEEATDKRLIAILADALRANTDMLRTPADIMDEAIQAKGLLRAFWATFTEARKGRIQSKAIRLYREAKADG